MKANYCLQCGHVMSTHLIDQVLRQHCEQCGWIFYPQIKVSAGGVIQMEHRLLLVKRANEPWKDAWYIPAGFMEENETPARTAEREILEETGLVVKADGLWDVIYYSDDPRGEGVLILYDCDLIGGRLQKTDETSEAAFFTVNEIPSPLAGSAHHEAVAHWIQMTKEK